MERSASKTGGREVNRSPPSNSGSVSRSASLVNSLSRSASAARESLAKKAATPSAVDAALELAAATAAAKAAAEAEERAAIVAAAAARAAEAARLAEQYVQENIAAKKAWDLHQQEKLAERVAAEQAWRRERTYQGTICSHCQAAGHSFHDCEQVITRFGRQSAHAESRRVESFHGLILAERAAGAAELARRQSRDPESHTTAIAEA
eukprot:c5413_g1_i1.p1 GENE.c5413_g1_i1~~c5413_g1_i1.p1  ORF type:complete len:217 (+),score=32.99 c5413_g1_i1:33-653(+)